MRAYYQNSHFLVNVRYGGWRDIREFVQPYNCDVLAISRQYGADYWSLYDFVCRTISYRRDIGEFWQFPSETLAWELGDCEDVSILLTSLLRPFTNAHVALGGFQGYGHAWCQLNGQILETTYTQGRPIPDPSEYQLMALFNDVDVLELYPGALAEVFALRRDESTKLDLIALALDP